MQGGKNFLGKNLQNFAGSGNLYDFTYHKLTSMMAQMLKWDPTHPDVLVLNNILELYVDGDVDISWAAGYPLAYPANSLKDFEDELYEELEDMGLLED